MNHFEKAEWEQNNDYRSGHRVNRESVSVKSDPVLVPLQVENPSCLWGRVNWGPAGDAETTEQYDSLLAQMNLFYHDVTQDLRKLKPTSLEEGQVTQHLQTFFTHIFTHLIQEGDAFLRCLNWTGGGLDVCVTAFLLRCVWCTGQ